MPSLTLFRHSAVAEVVRLRLPHPNSHEFGYMKVVLMPAVSARQLGKCFRMQSGGGGGAFGYRTLRDDVMAWVKKPWQLWQRAAKGKDFWALRDVNFDIEPGEVVGIIGHNGAGKSTLLKVLSRITKPSVGEVRLRGRVGSLLEVGTGFHPELTGRENIFLNGAILGMRRGEIQRKFDAIVEFAEIGEFLDTPVKRYSSGMYVRLAFAVAAHLEPEILIVDEVLAVGDMAFQRKCLGRMHDVGRSGTTILFVSHNMPAIESLCTRAILLDRGQVAMAGGVRELVREYHRRVLQTQETSGASLADLESPSRLIKIFQGVQMLDAQDQSTAFVPMGGEFRLRLQLQAPSPIDFPVVTIAIDDHLGQRMISLQTPLTRPVIERLQGDLSLECRVEQFPLAPGDYWVKLGISAGPDEIDIVDRVLRFTVAEADAFGSGNGFHRGVCIAPSVWSCT